MKKIKYIDLFAGAGKTSTLAKLIGLLSDTKLNNLSTSVFLYGKLRCNEGNDQPYDNNYLLTNFSKPINSFSSGL